MLQSLTYYLLVKTSGTLEVYRIVLPHSRLVSISVCMNDTDLGGYSFTEIFVIGS